MEGKEQSQMKPNSDQASRRQPKVAPLSSRLQVFKLTGTNGTLETCKRLESDTKITVSRPGWAPLPVQTQRKRYINKK